jgi:hypothetical protein
MSNKTEGIPESEREEYENMVKKAEEMRKKVEGKKRKAK